MTTRYERKYGSHYGSMSWKDRAMRLRWKILASAERHKVFLSSVSATAIALILYTTVVLLTFCYLGPRAIGAHVENTVEIVLSMMEGK
jgi:hypothetical protein